MGRKQGDTSLLRTEK